jgi:o-succinylbenzoate synthase
MLTAQYAPYQLQFSSPVLTSRGSMEYKNGYILTISKDGFSGKGECSFIEGLSPDDLAQYEQKLDFVCRHIDSIRHDYHQALIEFPSIRCGLEMALLELSTQKEGIYFESDFTLGKMALPINGLLWMGQKDYLIEQIHSKIAQGFQCLKMKVGALPFDQELELLSFIRHQFPEEDIELRLDANGAFTPLEALSKLEALNKFNIHSIEQPIKAGQWENMAKINFSSPIPIALDEELIGIYDTKKQLELLETIKPHYIILKPSLTGGFTASESWIELATSMNIAWWATSALESNIGLNAITQWAATQNNPLPQGLGTGGLYLNNFPSKLYIEDGCIKFNPRTA